MCAGGGRAGGVWRPSRSGGRRLRGPPPCVPTVTRGGGGGGARARPPSRDPFEISRQPGRACACVRARPSGERWGERASGAPPDESGLIAALVPAAWSGRRSRRRRPGRAPAAAPSPVGPRPGPSAPSRPPLASPRFMGTGRLHSYDIDADLRLGRTDPRADGRGRGSPTWSGGPSRGSGAGVGEGPVSVVGDPDRRRRLVDGGVLARGCGTGRSPRRSGG